MSAYCDSSNFPKGRVKNDAGMDSKPPRKEAEPEETRGCAVALAAGSTSEAVGKV